MLVIGAKGLFSTSLILFNYIPRYEIVKLRISKTLFKISGVVCKAITNKIPAEL
jgi:hypothetical protein